MSAKKRLDEKWIRDFYIELGQPCASADDINWVLSHWVALDTIEREVTISMLNDIQSKLKIISTGKQRHYRQALNNILVYLAQVCQWTLPERNVQLLRDTDLQWFDLLNQQAQFSYSLLSIYNKEKTHFLRYRTEITPVFAALVIAIEISPVSMNYLTGMLNTPEQIELFQSNLTIKVEHLDRPSSENNEPVFTRYAVSPFAYRVLNQYHERQRAAISPLKLTQQLNQWITKTPYSLPTHSRSQWHHAFQALWHYRDDLSPTLLKDMAYPSRHVAFELDRPTPVKRARALAHIYDQDWDCTWFDGLIPSTKKVIWPHLTLLQHHERLAKKTVHTVPLPIWDANNVLPVLFYHYTVDLIINGGVKKAVLSTATLRKYTGVYEKLTLQPLNYVDATEPSNLMAWAHQAYNSLDNDTSLLMLHYFFRWLRYHPLTDHFDLSVFEAPTLPISVDAFRLNVSDLNDVINALLTAPGSTSFQSLFSCLAAILGFFAMLRRGEILRLRIQDIYVPSEHKQLFRFTVTKTQEGDTKSKRSRTVYAVIPEEFAHLIRIALHIKKNCPPDTPLIGFEGEKMSTRQLHYLLPVTRTLKALFGPSVRIQHFRHSGAHLFFLQGMALLHEVQPEHLSNDPHTQRLLTQTVCEKRFNYWLEGRDFTLMNDNLIFDVMGKQLGHVYYATTRLSYLHGVEWLKPIIQSDNKPYSHSELRYIFGLSPTSNDVSRQLSRLSPDYEGLTIEEKKKHPIILSELSLAAAILRSPISTSTDMTRYDKAQKSYYKLWDKQVLKHDPGFLGEQTFDTLDLKKPNALDFSALSTLWHQSGRHQHLPLSKVQLTALKTLSKTTKICMQDNKITLTLACNKKNAILFTTLIRQPEWQWLSIAFTLNHNRKINISRQLTILQQQFARKGEVTTQQKIATGSSQLIISLSSKKISDTQLMQQLLHYFQINSTHDALNIAKD